MTVMMLLFTIIILKMSAINIFIDENDDYTDDNEFVNLLLFSIIMILKNSIMKILMTLIMLSLTIIIIFKISAIYKLMISMILMTMVCYVSIVIILKNSIMKILMILIMLLLIIDGNDDDNIDKDNDIVDENDYIILIIILIMIMLTIQELEKTLVLLSSQPQIWSSPQFISSWNSLLLSPFITLISPVSGIT